MTGLTDATRNITSRRHPLVQRCRQLAAGRGAADEILLDGEHLVDEAIAAGVRVRAVLARHPDGASASRARNAGAEVHGASADAIAAASPVRSATGIVAIGTWRPADLDVALTASRGITLALVDVQDPGNVGSVIRSADALGAEAVVAAGATADPAGWKALRGAMGSTFRVPVCRAPLDALIDHAGRVNARLVATTIGAGDRLEGARFDQPTVVLLGNEGTGLPDRLLRLAHSLLQVPMRPGVNSLNVAVTAALILYEAGRARRARPEPSR